MPNRKLWLQKVDFAECYELRSNSSKQYGGQLRAIKYDFASLIFKETGWLARGHFLEFCLCGAKQHFDVKNMYSLNVSSKTKRYRTIAGGLYVSFN